MHFSRVFLTGAGMAHAALGKTENHLFTTTSTYFGTSAGHYADCNYMASFAQVKMNNVAPQEFVKEKEDGSEVEAAEEFVKEKEDGSEVEAAEHITSKKWATIIVGNPETTQHGIPSPHDLDMYNASIKSTIDSLAKSGTDLENILVCIAEHPKYKTWDEFLKARFLQDFKSHEKIDKDHFLESKLETHILSSINVQNFIFSEGADLHKKMKEFADSFPASSSGVIFVLSHNPEPNQIEWSSLTNRVDEKAVFGFGVGWKDDTRKEKLRGNTKDFVVTLASISDSGREVLVIVAGCYSGEVVRSGIEAAKQEFQSSNQNRGSLFFISSTDASVEDIAGSVSEQISMAVGETLSPTLKTLTSDQCTLPAPVDSAHWLTNAIHWIITDSCPWTPTNLNDFCERFNKDFKPVDDVWQNMLGEFSRPGCQGWTSNAGEQKFAKFLQSEQNKIAAISGSRTEIATLQGVANPSHSYQINKEQAQHFIDLMQQNDLFGKDIFLNAKYMKLFQDHLSPSTLNLILNVSATSVMDIFNAMTRTEQDKFLADLGSLVDQNRAQMLEIQQQTFDFKEQQPRTEPLCLTSS